MISSVRFQGSPSSKPPQSPLIHPEGTIHTDIQPPVSSPKQENVHTQALREQLTSERPGLLQIEHLLFNANPNATISEESKVPLLYYAVRKGIKDRIAETLMQYGASLAPLPEDGSNLFHHLGAEVSMAEVDIPNLERLAGLLLRSGVDINAPNKQWKRPLDMALESRNVVLADILLSHDAKANYFNHQGVYPLTYLKEEHRKAAHEQYMMTLMGSHGRAAKAKQDMDALEHLIGKMRMAGAETSSKWNPKRAAVWLKRAFINITRQRQAVAAQS